MKKIFIFLNKTLVKRILFTLMILFIYRVGSLTPTPFINQQVWRETFNTQQNGLFDFVNILGGGAFKQFSLFSLSVSPYITASLIVQLLSQDVVPALTRWEKEGVNGKRKKGYLIRNLSLILAFFQALALAISFNTMNDGKLLTISGDYIIFVYVSIFLTAGTAIIMWLSDMITKKGVGNGTSMIILSGIISQLPIQVTEIWKYFNKEQITHTGTLISFLVYLLLLGMIVAVIFMQEAERRIPIQYSNAIVLNKLKRPLSYLPLKLNSAGVIPVIFSTAIVSFPLTISLLFFSGNDIGKWIINNFKLTSPMGFSLYLLLTFLFSYFYAFVQISPEKAAKNLARQDAFIPGIRIGIETQKYLTKVLWSITTVGSIYLIIVITIPVIVEYFLNIKVIIGGTSAIILAGVAIETVKQIKNQYTIKKYDNYLID